MKNTKSLFSIERPKIYKNYSKNAEVILHRGDTYKFIKTLPSGEVTLIITSPPYNIGKVYEDKTTLENYLSYQKKVISELKRVLSNKGSICWEIGNYIEKSEVYPLDFYYYEIFKELGFKLRNRIIWHFGHGLHCRKRFSGRYETILWFTKTDNYVFNLDDVRVPAKYPGKRHYKGKNKGKPSGNPLGKNPSDVWTVIKQDWDKEVWEIPNVKSNHPEKTMVGKILYNPKTLNSAFKEGFKKFGWETVRIMCDYPTKYYNKGYKPKMMKGQAFREMDFIKEKLGVEVQFGKYAFMVYNVAAKMTIFRNHDYIDAGVEIVPMKEFAENMSTGVSYFEQFVWDLDNRGVSNIDVPALIFGIGANPISKYKLKSILISNS